MEKRSQVELVSYNIKNVEICASAARISTTAGNALEVLEKSRGNEKNADLIRKVLQSGHKSIMEHVVFTFAFKDVSAFVEQFFIECRLASFTVKSRRYVDFGGLGYYMPPDLEGEDRDHYRQYMDKLFGAYKMLLDNGVPKEDARFLLPYSFHSNFYCTMNARQLEHTVWDMRKGRGRGIPELQDIADQIKRQAEAAFPCMDLGTRDASGEYGAEGDGADAFRASDSLTFVAPAKAGAVSLVNEPSNPAGILNVAYRISHPAKNASLDVGELLESGRPRELEQLTYTFVISDITLSGITHIVRHRMQSVIIPSIQGVEHGRCILPDTIKNDPGSLEVYRNALDEAARMTGRDGRWRRYGYYYALSGNVMDIMTTMNARELMHFIRLRACNRAQWEIRNIAVEMLEQLRVSFPELFGHYGPSCFMSGKCPEGRLTCGRMQEVINKFSHENTAPKKELRKN